MNRARWKAVRAETPGDTRGYFLRRASVAGLSWLNSWHEWWESALFDRRVAATELTEPPIFILGHWRSGTTLLHNLLTLDPQLATPNLYQVMFSGHFLLTERLVTALTGWMMPATRPMDNVPAGWQYSQEDEVAIMLRTGLSPYRMLLHQGDPSQYERFFELVDVTPEERQRWIDDFRLFLKKLTYKTRKPIVLKSPTHTYRIPLLLELFPNARFLSIMRDPYTVYSSTVHLRKTMFIENGLARPNFTGLEAEILDTYDKCLRRYEETKALIPAGQLHELRFEDLEADPLAEMRRVYQALGLPGWEAMEPKLTALLPEHRAYKKNSFQLDPATKALIADRCRWVFDRYGYPVDTPQPAEAAA